MRRGPSIWTVSSEAAGMRSTRFQNRAARSLQKPSAIPRARYRRRSAQSTSQELGATRVRQRDARAPSTLRSVSAGRTSSGQPLVAALRPRQRADLWLEYAGFESAQQENYEKLRRRIRRVLDSVLNRFKLHKANKLSKKLFRVEKTLAS